MALRDRVEEHPVMASIMWSDPCTETDWFLESQRGAGYMYGEKAVGKFLAETGLGAVVRSHQLIMDGAREDFDKRCITVWSAPNYGYKCRNMASIMVISDRSHKFIYFSAAKKQYDADRHIRRPFAN